MLRDRLETVVSFEAWVIGGVCRGKVGNLVPGAADTVAGSTFPSGRGCRDWYAVR